MPLLLAAAALAVVAVVIAYATGAARTRTQPATSAGAAAAKVLSDLPGTPLEVNATMRSGVDDKLKPRDVWRVRLLAQQPYTIEIEASVADGIGLGLARPGASQIPEAAETAEFSICSDSTRCTAPFTPSVTGEYYVVVYGMRPNAGYTLSVRDR
jgi:hypothetical protein